MNPTKGFWIAIKPPGAPYWGINAPESSELTVAGTSSGFSEADAKLAASAPRMLAALQAIRALRTYSISQGICIDPSPDSLLKAAEVYQIINDALGSTPSGGEKHG